jgi:hypothetical protein
MSDAIPKKTANPTPRTYSDMAVLRIATLKEIYHLPLRDTQGLMGSIELIHDARKGNLLRRVSSSGHRTLLKRPTLPRG